MRSGDHWKKREEKGSMCGLKVEKRDEGTGQEESWENQKKKKAFENVIKKPNIVSPNLIFLIKQSI